MTQSQRFRERLADFRARVLELQEHALQMPPIPDLLDEVMLELANTLEELDVTEEEMREQAEMLEDTRDALTREQHRYQQLFELAPDAYVVTDLFGSIQQANITTFQLLNLAPQYLIHKPLIVFVEAEQRQAFRKLVANIRSTGSPTAYELILQPRGNREPITVIATMTLSYNSANAPSTIHWAFVDISERKRLENQLKQVNNALFERVVDRTAELEDAIKLKDELLIVAQNAREEAEQANALKLKLLATISHELRTPLTSIKGFASTLLADDVTWEIERWQSFVTIIDDEANKLTELVEQLLDLSRLQAGALRIHVEPRPLTSVLKLAKTQLESLASEHQLTIDIPSDLPPVSIDQWRIAQVLVNLVGNASKYSPGGTPIRVSAHRLNGHIEVEVADQGPGIPAEEREQVFEAFFQSDGQLLRRPGVGLGLAICKGLIEQHEGKIWIADRESPGTTVCFTLPIDPPQAARQN